MRKMRDFAENELLEKFDVRDYYDTVLLSGAVPLEVLEARVKEYVEKNGGTSDSSAKSRTTPVEQPSSSVRTSAKQSMMDIMTFANWCKCCVVPGACQDDLIV
jgi:hypothetical protein